MKADTTGIKLYAQFTNVLERSPYNFAGEFQSPIIIHDEHRIK